ncbi:MAG: ABC transporter substrate-binding protein, partial [Candidatus Hodarchaeota archaeon]
NGDPGFILADVVDNVTVVSDLVFTIYLSSADATFLQRLTYTVAWPISPETLPVGEISGTPDEYPAGLGPYMITTWTKDTEMILELNPYYFGAKPKNDKVIIKFYATATALQQALTAGDIDVAHREFGPDEMTALIEDEDIETEMMSSAGIRYLLFNVDIIDDINVRRAIAAAMDRDDICSTIFDNWNLPIYSMVPKVFEATGAIDVFMDGSPTDPSVAGNMTLSGYSTTNKYAIDLWYTPSHYGDTEDDVAQLIEQQLEETGYFDVTLKSAEWTTFLDQLGTMPFFLLGWWFDWPDPSNYIDPFVGAGSVSMGVNYSTAEMDGYIDTMLTNPDAAARKLAVQNAQILTAKDCPNIPLFDRGQQFMAWIPGVEGVKLEPSENVHYDSMYHEEEDEDDDIPLPILPVLFAVLTLSVVRALRKRH